MATPLIQSVLKAFNILSAFEGRGPVLSTTEIARHSGMNSKTVHRFLLSLESVGAVTRVGRGRYTLGMALADLGTQVAVHRVLAEAAEPHIASVAEEWNEAVQVGVLENNEIVSVAHVPSRHTLSIGIRVGMRWPAYCTAIGKTLLSDMEPALLDDYIENTRLEKRTEYTITSSQKLRRHLADVRKQGFAVNDQESERGIRSIAVPVRNRLGRYIAALSISGPTTRLPTSLLPRISDGLRECGNAISHTLYGEAGPHTPHTD